MSTLRLDHYFPVDISSVVPLTITSITCEQDIDSSSHYVKIYIESGDISSPFVVSEQWNGSNNSPNFINQGVVNIYSIEKDQRLMVRLCPFDINKTPISVLIAY